MIAVRSSDLKRALNRVKPYVPEKSTLPILRNVLLEVRAGKLWVTATDLDIMASVPISLVGEADDSLPAVAVDCRTLLDLVQHSGGEHVRFWAEGDAFLAAPSENAIAKLRTLPAREFPLPPLGSAAAEALGCFTSESLQAVYRRVVPFAASDETHPMLQTVRLRLSETEAEFAAADGFKAAILKVGYEGRRCEELDLPARAFAFMGHSQGQVSLKYEEEGSKRAMLAFEDAGGAILYASCYTEGYPKLDEVFPRVLTDTFAVSVPVWQQGLKTIASRRKKPLDEGFPHVLQDGVLTITSHDGHRLAICRVPVEMLGGRGQACFVLCREYILTVLQCACGYVEVSFRSYDDLGTEIASPFVFESPGWTALLMPMAKTSFWEESRGEAQALVSKLEALEPVEERGGDV